MANMTVQVGQVWEDTDSRMVKSKGHPRRVRVVSIGNADAVVENVITGRRTLIALKRFRPTSTGYRLVTPEQDH